MTDHLPECLMSPALTVRPCICPELRACEQRVRRRVANDAEIVYAEVERAAYAAGVQDARDAVAALTPMRTLTGVRTFSKREALAAIDALKGDTNA